MERVLVPKYVADWYEVWSTGFLSNKLSELQHVSGKMEQWIDSLETDDRYGMEIAQEIIAKMHLYGYEVERDKYYWRKKKEYLCDFEKHWDIYLNFDESDDSVRFSVNKFEGGYIQTKFTRVEVLNLVGEKDFDKLERVEITD